MMSSAPRCCLSHDLSSNYLAFLRRDNTVSISSAAGRSVNRYEDCPILHSSCRMRHAGRNPDESTRLQNAAFVRREYFHASLQTIDGFFDAVVNVKRVVKRIRLLSIQVDDPY